MKIIDVFTTYIHYLIHPFKTHEAFINPDRVEGFVPQRLSPYESLTTSWVFVILNGIFRIVTLNFVILLMLDLISDTGFDYSSFLNIEEFPSLYFVVLSSVLDIIFYPLFGIFMIQFWEFIIKLFANLLNVSGDVSEKSQDIISVYFSSSILKIIPIFGAPMQSLASMILMYAGLRKQLNASPILSVCIILTPLVIMLGLASVIILLALLAL
ncbi:MAG: hypothetical protein ACJAS4_000201 [Bacteriovoracaceae bacterium]|jgi:hypothetical protein